MSYLEDARSRCEMSNKFSVKYFSHLTIIKISEFTLRRKQDLSKMLWEEGKEGRERSLKIASRVGHSSKIRESRTEIPVLKQAQRVNMHSSTKYDVDTKLACSELIHTLEAKELR